MLRRKKAVDKPGAVPHKVNRCAVQHN